PGCRGHTVPVEHVIALDVGGTGMKAALVGAGGELLHQARRATGRDRGPEAVVTGILDFAAELRAHGVRRYGRPASAAGLAVPGIVDEREGLAVYSANLGWRDLPLRALLAERLGGVPVALGHDVRTGGLAEGRIGAGRARTASRARSATSSSGPAAPRARAAGAAAWSATRPPRRSARRGRPPAATRTPTRRTAPRPSRPGTSGPARSGRRRSTPSPT